MMTNFLAARVRFANSIRSFRSAIQRIFAKIHFREAKDYSMTGSLCYEKGNEDRLQYKRLEIQCTAEVSLMLLYTENHLD